jgi:hypothetical protein
MPQPRIHGSHAQRQAAYRRRCREANEAQLREEGLPNSPAISTMPGAVRWRQAVAKVLELLLLVEEEMQEYYSDRSEAWHESERAEEFQERIGAIVQARESVEEIVEG